MILLSSYSINVEAAMLENLELSLENFTSWFREASKQTMAVT